MPADIDVAIVTFRRKDLALRCLASIEDALGESGAPSLAVHVVDNASADGTAEAIAAQFPDVTLVRNSANRGFAAATNQAIRAGDAAYVLALNPDARIGTGTLGPLLKLLEEDRKIGMAGPNLLRPDGTTDHAAKRSFPTVGGALAYFSKLDRVFPSLGQYAAPDSTRGEVDAINGAFMLMRREALDDVGLFDEGYWMYMEDLDLCYRFWQRGWKVCFEPAAIAWHDKGGSAGAVRNLRLNFAFHYGMYRFYRKWRAHERAAIFNGLVYGGIGVKLALSTLRGALVRALAPDHGRQRERDEPKVARD